MFGVAACLVELYRSELQGQRNTNIITPGHHSSKPANARLGYVLISADIMNGHGNLCAHIRVNPMHW